MFYPVPLVVFSRRINAGSVSTMLLETEESLWFFFLYSQLDFTLLERSNHALDFPGLLHKAVSVFSGHSVIQIDVWLGNTFICLISIF